MDKFSARHGFEASDAEITVRHEAPNPLREIVVDIAYEVGLTPHSMRGLVCTLLRIPENRGNWSAFPNVDGEVRDNLSGCEWYEVYDAIEAIHSWLASRDEEEPWDRAESRAECFAAELNKYFRRQGIGWQLVGGQIQVRGPEAFEAGLKEAQVDLCRPIFRFERDSPSVDGPF